MIKEREYFMRLLAEARDGNSVAQKRVMIVLNANYHKFDDVNSRFALMNDDDLQWIRPLALSLYVPAVKVLHTGMMRSAFFTLDKDLLNEIDKRINEQIPTMSTGEMLELFLAAQVKDLSVKVRVWYYYFHKTYYKALNELHCRGIKAASLELGKLYRNGDIDEEVPIDRKKAKEYYAAAGEEYDKEDD